MENIINFTLLLLVTLGAFMFWGWEVGLIMFLFGCGYVIKRSCAPMFNR